MDSWPSSSPATGLILFFWFFWSLCPLFQNLEISSDFQITLWSLLMSPGNPFSPDRWSVILKQSTAFDNRQKAKFLWNVIYTAHICLGRINLGVTVLQGCNKHLRLCMYSWGSGTMAQPKPPFSAGLIPTGFIPNWDIYIDWQVYQSN